MFLRQSRSELARLAVGRQQALFNPDIGVMLSRLKTRLEGRRVLVIGGAGSIGSATVSELSEFRLAALHVVDQNENNLTELVRFLRSRPNGLNIEDFATLPVDFGSAAMRRFLFDSDPYDFVLNFAAAKHVRSEKDPYSLLHMFDTNVVKALRLMELLAKRGGTKSYFCVSTDKAANPVNLMGASKRLMEQVVFGGLVPGASGIAVNSARFANVAYSDGSLLDGWLRRIENSQPLAVPQKTRRYFITPHEAGQLCLLAAVGAPPNHLLVPRLHPETDLQDLESLALSLLRHLDRTPSLYMNEVEARAAMVGDLRKGCYPLLLTPLDTSGEKAFEEFVGIGEMAVAGDMPNLLGISPLPVDPLKLAEVVGCLRGWLEGDDPTPAKSDFVELIRPVIPGLEHVETNKQLDRRM